MSLTLKERFLMCPEYWGAWAGSVTLGTAALIVNVLLFYGFSGYGSVGLDAWFLTVIGVRAVPGLFWGAILGRSGGRAGHHWLHGGIEDARRVLRRAGAWCTVLNGAWLILPILFSIRLMALGLNMVTAIGYPILTNVCLQASVLTLVASYVLPRREEERVQVTENLRL